VHQGGDHATMTSAVSEGNAKQNSKSDWQKNKVSNSPSPTAVGEQAVAAVGALGVLTTAVTNIVKDCWTNRQNTRRQESRGMTKPHGPEDLREKSFRKRMMPFQAGRMTRMKNSAVTGAVVWDGHSEDGQDLALSPGS